MSIPNQLTVYIHTPQIPTAPLILYNPSMTIPNINSKNIHFNPLIRLTQGQINNIQIGSHSNRNLEIDAQFLDPNMFRNLLNRSGNIQKVNTLIEATKEGIIDNNIELTLKNLFRPNSVIRINGKKYTIYSMDWKSGNWEIKPNASKKIISYRKL